MAKENQASCSRKKSEGQNNAQKDNSKLGKQRWSIIIIIIRIRII